MTGIRILPLWAFALTGVLGLAATPEGAFAQRRPTPRVATLQLQPADASIVVGQTQYFIAEAYDASNNPIISGITVRWSSSNASVATVDQGGIATGRAPGLAFVTAVVGTGAAARSASATLTVTPAAAAVVLQAQTPPAQPVGQPATPPTQPAPRPAPAGVIGAAAMAMQPAGSGQADGLVMTPTRLVMVRGESRQLGYQAVRLDGQSAEPVPLLFSVQQGGERIVSVDSVGRVRALGEVGQTAVRVEVPGIQRILPRQVAVDVRSDSVRFSRQEVRLTPGSEDTLQIEVPSQSRALELRGEYQFSSSDDAVVRVSPLRPVISAVGPGTATITGDNGYQLVRTQISVHRSVSGFTAAPADTAVARFDTATKTLTGVAMGEGVVRVSAPFRRDSLVSRQWRVRVVAGGLALSTTRIGLGAGESAPLGIQLLDDQRRPIGPATNVQWASTNDSIARFSDGRIVTGITGRAVLTARARWDSAASVEVFVVGPMVVPLQRGGRWDLHWATYDSTPRLTPITSDAAFELEPAFGPDLTRIAYVVAPPERPTSLEVFVANSDGSEARRVTSDSATAGSPAFHPSGDRIVYHSNRGGRPGVYVINLDGTGQTQLVPGDAPADQPGVSPDGRRVAFRALRQTGGGPRNYDIFEIGIDGTGERQITNSPRPEERPQYSADGRLLYYLRDEGGSPPSKRLYRHNLETGVAEPLTPMGVFVTSYSISSDGSRIVLTRLEQVPRVGDVPRQALFDTGSQTLTPIHVPQGEQMSSPVLRPAAPAPRAPATQ